MARQIISAGGGPVSGEAHRVIPEEHPEYGDALLRLAEENFAVTLYRHADRPGWLWYIAMIDGSPVVGRLDTREHLHSWLSVDDLLLHFGVLSPNTKSFTLAPIISTKLPDAYSTYSDSEYVYIAVTPASIPIKIHFADEAGTPFYTIERNILSVPQQDAGIPWSVKLKFFLLQHGLLPTPPENKPERQRILKEMADRIWNEYKE